MSNHQEQGRQNTNSSATQPTTSQQSTALNSRDQPANGAPSIRPSYTTTDLGLRRDDTETRATGSDKRVTNGV